MKTIQNVKTLKNNISSIRKRRNFRKALFKWLARNYYMLFFVFCFTAFTNLGHSQTCINLPPINCPAQISMTCSGYTPSSGSPDIISGNGLWLGGLFINNVNGASVSGGTMTFFAGGPSGAETMSTVLTGLIPGTQYTIPLQWQQCQFLDVVGNPFTFGGMLSLQIIGMTEQLYTSSGVTDNWQTVNYTFVATNTTHTFKIGHALTLGTIVVDNINCFIPLQTELTNVNIQCNSNYSATLFWNVEGEANCDHYDILSSSDGISFSKSGTVECSGQNNYSYQLNNTQDITYLQLNRVEWDGNEVNYGTYNLNCNADNITVFQIPEENNIIITAPKKYGETELTIIDATGRIVAYKTHNFQQNEKLIFSLDEFSDGVYFITTTSQTGVTTSNRILII